MSKRTSMFALALVAVAMMAALVLPMFGASPVDAQYATSAEQACSGSSSYQARFFTAFATLYRTSALDAGDALSINNTSSKDKQKFLICDASLSDSDPKTVIVAFIANKYYVKVNEVTITERYKKDTQD
ncbi:MAG TPA: hypothetical protein PLD47_00600 [Aggregatilineales bacterium]|nr:hypothetical protein [Anaerolineales bacterium]HRE46198.1 hypothetical protein [Aggregatilineales bacterium]